MARGRRKAIIAAAVMLGAGVCGTAAGTTAQAAPAAGRAGLARGTDPSSTVNVLDGVSADAGTDAWAVGSYVSNTTKVTDTLTEHWNGSAWSQVASPDPGAGNALFAVAASSPVSAWAVGSYLAGSATVALIVHWDGTVWTQVPSPTPAGCRGSQLAGVTVISGTDAWAVGSCRMHGSLLTLILHWNGTAWADVPSPSPGRTDNLLSGVSAVSASDVWAAGSYLNDKTSQIDTLTLRWNGTAWARIPSPNPSAPPHGTSLAGVSAVSGTDAWAAGTFGGLTTGGPEPLLLHWNGTTWRQQQSPAPALAGVTQPPVFASVLNGVNAVSGTDAWAVGDSSEIAPKRTPDSTMTLHWNGTTWTSPRSPNQRPGSDQLNGVSTVSAIDAWAVGTYTSKSVTHTLILHWNGKSWSIA